MSDHPEGEGRREEFSSDPEVERLVAAGLHQQLRREDDFGWVKRYDFRVRTERHDPVQQRTDISQAYSFRTLALDATKLIANGQEFPRGVRLTANMAGNLAGTDGEVLTRQQLVWRWEDALAGLNGPVLVIQASENDPEIEDPLSMVGLIYIDSGDPSTIRPVNLANVNKVYAVYGVAKRSSPNDVNFGQATFIPPHPVPGTPASELRAETAPEIAKSLARAAFSLQPERMGLGIASAFSRWNVVFPEPPQPPGPTTTFFVG